MKNISQEDYILWDTEKNKPVEWLDTVYHYTTLIDDINRWDCFILCKWEQLIPVSNLSLDWKLKISQAIELTK